MSVLHTGGITTLSDLIKMRALKVFAIILISCSCCGYAAPTESLASIIEKCRLELPRYKDTLLNSTFLPFLNKCDKTETTAKMCNSYLEMVVILNNTPNQTLFETQADVNERLLQLPKSFNTSNIFDAFCTNFTENYPNNTKYYAQRSNKMNCFQCSDNNEDSNISKLCGLIYIGYAERNLKHTSTHLIPVVSTPILKDEEAHEPKGKTSGIVEPIKLPTPIVSAKTNEKDSYPNQSDAQQSQDFHQESALLESPKPHDPPLITSTAKLNNNIPKIPPSQHNETTNTLEGHKAIPTPKPLPKVVESDVPPQQPSKSVSQPVIVEPQELPKSELQSEDEIENHEDDDLNETGTEVNQDYANEDVENPNTDQESSPVVVKYEKPQKLEVSPINPKDTVIIRTAVADDPYADNVDSNFFAYFMFLMFVCVVCYVGYHNKSKVLALLLEGRRTSGGRNGIGRRKHTAAYRKLDTNLEEAISSNSSGRTTQIIY